jgi:hypothetical protein
MSDIIEYNQNNLQVFSDIIRKNLTSDLIAKKWKDRNFSNPTFGHCHTASGCLYKIFGPKAMHMYRGFDGEIYHWWVVDKTGVLIDLTSEQYTSIGKVPPYDKSEKCGMLGFDYRKRVMTLYERVMKDYDDVTTKKQDRN